MRRILEVYGVEKVNWEIAGFFGGELVVYEGVRRREEVEETWT